MRSRLFLIGSAFTAAAVPAAAQATGQDYSTLTSAVDFSTVITAIMAVAALLLAVLVVRKGVRFVLGAIK